MSDSNHQVTWKPTRPEFTITFIRGTSTNRGYHESWFEVISRNPLDIDDWKRLDECGLIGMGQAYDVESVSTITDTVQPVTIDRRTGKALDVPCLSWSGKPITETHDYTYHRYVVKRICDSGD
jgi:hypothetical protein